MFFDVKWNTCSTIRAAGLSTGPKLLCTGLTPAAPCSLHHTTCDL